MGTQVTIALADETYRQIESFAKLANRDVASILADIITIENVERSHKVEHTLAAEYQDMAKDEEQETLAIEWAETFIGDVADEVW